MNYKLIGLIIYGAVLFFVCLRILYDTHSSTKTIAYLLLCIFFPVFGIIFYLAFGINYWKKKLYSGKMNEDSKMLDELKKKISQYKNCTIDPRDLADDYAEIASMLLKDLRSLLSCNNRVKLLVNGEEKFPELIKCLQQAKHHIHIEYYIFEEDDIGTQIIEILIEKAKEGVQVKFIYDDFGSPSIKKKIERKMQAAGIEVYPFSKVIFYLLANRINYRNHRKIVVIDGQTGFVGGINVNDKYINNGKQKLYWRDTHVRIDGPGVYYLQYIFITDWNFCCPKKFKPTDEYFAPCDDIKDGALIQIAGSGPDSEQPSILFSILEAINLAKEEILITTPYFIPGDSISNALRSAALGDVTVKLLVPGKCDSRIVNAASKSYYNDLLQAGVEIYLYEKGFVHAKTLVTDGKLSMVGTANMDHRSFELNFEVNAIIYDAPFAKKLRKVFSDDIKHAKKLDAKRWYKRSLLEQFPEKVARLLSPSL
ncbi:MAG: cardiolipin synthase [Parafilimonas sp.]